MSNENQLKINNLSVSYGNNKVLENLSFSVDGLCAVVGQNGCGKTTLLKAVSQLIDSSGEIIFENNDIRTLSLKEKSRLISYIPQKTGVSEDMSVLDVVLSAFNSRLSMFESPSSSQIQKAENALNFVGLENFGERNYSTLSAGQQQLCIIARTVAEDTKLWLLDEPDSALDIVNRYSTMKLLSVIAKEKGVTGLVTLHDPMLALYSCKKVIVISEGKCAGIIDTKTDSQAEIEKVMSKAFCGVKVVKALDRYAIFPCC